MVLSHFVGDGVDLCHGASLHHFVKLGLPRLGVFGASGIDASFLLSGF